MIKALQTIPELGCGLKAGALQKVDNEFAETQGNQIKDIELLKKLGRKNQICPYQYNHLVQNLQDIILCPYSYLMGHNVRNSFFKHLAGPENAEAARRRHFLIILDEAHNISDAACEGEGCRLSLKQLRREAKVLEEIIK